MNCPDCSHQSPPGARFCVFCGKAFPARQEDSAPCAGCGRSVKKGFKFCPFCGHMMEQQCCLSCALCGKAAGPQGLCAEHMQTHVFCPQCRKPFETAMELCPACRLVTYLPQDFTLTADDYEHSADREAMKTLRTIKAIPMVIEQLSRKFGKSFIESRFIGGGIKVNTLQFPRIHHLAVMAARILGVRRLPEIYISGDIGWSSDTYGSETDAFIVIGTFLARSLSDIELLFILGHEMAHVKSGHAMYRTVAQVFAGYSGPRGVMGGGILGLLDVQKLLTTAIEIPLLAWIRESEITGDHAGLLVAGQAMVARKVLLLQALRSPDLYKEINQEAYLKQQEDMENQIGKLSEMLQQSTPYVARRIRFVEEYVRSPLFSQVKARMENSRDLQPLLAKIRSLSGTGQPAPSQNLPGDEPRSPLPHHEAQRAVPRPPDDRLRGHCPHCRTPYSVPKSRIPAGAQVNLRCEQCRKTFPLSDGVHPRPPQDGTAPRQDSALRHGEAPTGSAPVELLKGLCAHCRAPYSVPKSRIPAGAKVELRCAQCKKTFPLSLPPVPSTGPRTDSFLTADDA